MREIKIGRVYRHFKGDYYLVEGVANDSETGAPFVIYRKLYGDGGLWLRPLEMFLSKVDKKKNIPMPRRSIGLNCRRSKAQQDTKKSNALV